MSNTISLKKSAVEFNPADHTYQLDGRYISGITPIIKWVYDTYKDIPEDVLARAAEHGKDVHLDCQMADAGFEPTSREAEAYVRLKAERGLVTLTNEWLVDDGKDIASSIDVVFDDFSIGDIKATSKLHYDNVTLQLSIYAWLLEKMNPEVKVPAIYVIWLPREQYGSPLMTKLERIPSDICFKIVDMYLAGDSNDGARHLLGLDEETPAAYADLEQEYCQLDTEAKAIKARMDAIKEELMHAMQETGDTSYAGDLLTASYIVGKESTKIDTAKVKKLYPDIYTECSKTEKTKDYIQIKIKKQ